MNDARNSYICRLCLKFNRKTISLYNSRNLESLRINKIVQQVCSIKLKQDEPFPRCICYPCKVKVISTQEFINTCKESDKTLRKIYCMSNDKDVKSEHRISLAKEPEKNKVIEENKMEIDHYDDTLGRTRSLRSNTKVALIASLPLTVTNTSTCNVKQKLDDCDDPPDQKMQIIDDYKYCEVKNDVQEVVEVEIEDKVQEEKKETNTGKNKDESTRIPFREENEGVNKSNIKIEPMSNNEDNQSSHPGEILENNLQITIKEEFIIPDNENEGIEEPVLNYQIDSNDSNHSMSDIPVENTANQNENNIEIKQEPIEEEKNKTEKEETLEKGNIYKIVIDEHEEEIFKRKLQYEKVTNPKIMYRKANTDLEPGLFHKITSCPICNRVYDRKGNLYNHLKLQHNLLSMKEVHKVLSARKELFIREHVTCNICNKDFNSKSTFNDHQVEHPDHMMQVQCENCNASFTSLNSKRRHQQLSCNKPYECLFCNTKFRTFKDFRFHMNTHRN